jgi:hypothetical protein
MPPIRLVILFVGLTLLGSLAGIIVLASQQHPIPDVLQNVAVGSLTGLVGLLVPSRTPAGE